MKVGALLARSGPGGLWTPSCEAALLLAAAELNAAGGVEGRLVEVVVADCGWTEAEAAEAAASLTDLEGVDAIVGMHPSMIRPAIRRQIAGRLPYIYTPQYEGGEHAANVLATGRTNAQLLNPTVPWLSAHRGAERFFLVCSDYVWPRSGSVAASAAVAASGGRVVGHEFVRFGCTDYSAVLDAVRDAQPDVVVMFLLGMEAVRFCRAFANAGLAKHVIRFGLGFDETMLLSVGSDAAENLFVAAGYIATQRSDGNDAFLERYHDGFGTLAPPANTFARSCFDAVHLLGGLARQAPKGRAQLYWGVEPKRRVADRRIRTAQPAASVHLAVADEARFEIIASFD